MALKERLMPHSASDLSLSAADILNSVREPILILNSNLQVQRANQAFYAAFQVNPSETINRKIYELGDGQWNIPALRQLLDDILPRNAVVEDCEVCHDFPTIGRKVMQLNARRIVRDGTHGEFILLTIKDVTDRRQVQDSEREARSRLESTLAAGEVGTWEFNVVTNKVWADANLARMFGVSPEAAFGGKLEDYLAAIHPEDFDRVTKTIGEALVAGDGYESDYRLICPDGEVRWVVARGRVERDDTGRPLRLPGVVIDITNQRRAEHALRASEERFHTVFDTMDEGFCVIEVDFDATGRPIDYRHVEVNSAFERHTGLKGGVGKSVREAVPTLEEFWYEVFGRVAATGESAHFEHHASALDDRWFAVSATRLGGPGSRRVAVLFTNISARKKAELDRERLVVQLEEQDRRKDEFLATLAHELRNPLAPIRNALEILSLAEANTEMVTMARDIMGRQVSQMVRLIDDLLEISRISQDKLILRREKTTLSAALASAIEVSGPLIDSLGHELKVIPCPDEITMYADPVRLAQIFHNLLNNAAKYTDRGGQITVSSEFRNNFAIISIRDNGIGIPAEMLLKIFELFTQVDRSLEKSQGGLGIGLSLVRNLVEMHGGTVEAHSEGVAGRGSEFMVRLPATVEKPHDTGPSSGSGDQSDGSSTRRIVIADDNVDSANSLSTLLKMLGNDVWIAHDGLDAIDVVAEFQPQFVLLDIGMPKLNGYETCRQIRRKPWGQAMVLIALTGWGQEHNRLISVEAGFDYHLIKPVEIGELTRIFESSHGVSRG